MVPPGDNNPLNFRRNVAENLVGIELDDMSDSDQVDNQDKPTPDQQDPFDLGFPTGALAPNATSSSYH